jgi:hypothetical protein
MRLMACRRLDLARPWSYDDYIAGPIRDSLRVVAWALDKVVKECLGDPQDSRVIFNTIEKTVWNSSLKLSSALGSTPVKVTFDERGHRVLPMALGVLVNGTWQVAGVYDPALKLFAATQVRSLISYRSVS